MHSQDKYKSNSFDIWRRFVAIALIYLQLLQIAAAVPLTTLSEQPKFPNAEYNYSPPSNVMPNIGILTPIADYFLNNQFTLNNNLLDFSCPFNWGITYSDLTGLYVNAQYVLPIGDSFAIGAVGEYGNWQYRINGTLGYSFTPFSQLKFTAERFGQRLPFEFDSGSIKTHVHQDALGLRFQQLFNQPWMQGLSFGGYYAKANNKQLDPVIFVSNGFNCNDSDEGFLCINYRNIAGASSRGIDAGAQMLLTPSTLLKGHLYYDDVTYNTIFTPYSIEDQIGFGGGVKVHQLLSDRFQLSGEATVRKIYDTYQAWFSWLPPIPYIGMELAVGAQHIVSHNATPDNTSVSLQMTLFTDGKKYNDRFEWENNCFTDIAGWVRTPAIVMKQVLAVAEQITQVLGPAIMSISPVSGPMVGGNIVTITGSNFMPGLLIYFGGVLASNIQVVSPNTVLVTAPAGTAPGSVPIVLQNPDGQQTTFSPGYTYEQESPFVTVQPSDQTASSGDTATFSANASGFPAPTVQWQISTDNGGSWSDIPGATNTTYVTPALTTADNNNQYRAVFSNTAGTANSNAATLTIEDIPIVTTQPANQTASSGDTATFSADASGFPAPTVQWQISTDNGGSWSNIAGATNTTYITPALTTADNNNQYRAVFSNNAGTTNSNAATLTIEDIPVVTTQPANQTESSGDTATFSADASGFPAPTVQWQISTDNGGSWSDIPGATNTTYVTPALTTTDDANQYRAVFTNSVGTATSDAATLTIEDIPVVTTQPSNQTESSGDTATFSADASGFPAPTVQWQISTDNGGSWSNIAGATNTTYITPALTTADNNNQYRAVFSNTAGTANSNAATLTIEDIPVVTTQPANQTESSGDTATFSADASGFPAPTVQWQISTDNGGSWSNIPGATNTTYVTPALTTTDNNNQYRAVFTNIAGTATSNAATLTIEDIPVVTTQPANQTESSGDTATFSADASGFPAPTVQWQISTDNGGSWSDIPGATNTTYVTPALTTTDDANQYRAVFTNSVGTATSDAAILTIEDIPVVTTQPSNQTESSGDTATFSADASGFPAPTVQWQISTDNGGSWSDIASATNTTYVTPALTTADNNNQYRAVFTNSAGTATSNAATLTIEDIPVVTTQPANQTASSGDTATFSADASGFPAPTVQWQISTDNGGSWSNILGATNTTYVTPTLTTTDDANQYRAVFTNSAGTATTDAATLTIEDIPVITTQPSDITVTDGNTATFNADASGFPAPTVQWQISTDNGGSWSDIPGATNTTYITPALNSGDDNNQYRAVFSNNAGTTSSNAATVTVLAVGSVYSDGVIYEIQGSTVFVVGMSDAATSVLWDTFDPPADMPTSSDNGQFNTYNILIGANFQAAQACRDYLGGGFQWYLPARSQWATLGMGDVLDVIKDVPGFTAFPVGTSYWTSTQSAGAGFAFLRNFSNPTSTSEVNANKNLVPYRVRCVKTVNI